MGYYYKIDCQNCHSVTFAAILDKLKFLRYEKQAQAKMLSIRLCGSCFSYICAETKTIYERIGPSDESPARKSGLSRATMMRSNRKETLFNFSSSREETPKYNLMKSRTLQFDELNESLLDFDTRRDALNNTIKEPVDSLDVIEYYLNLFPELASQEPKMTANVLEKVNISIISFIECWKISTLRSMTISSSG